MGNFMVSSAIRIVTETATRTLANLFFKPALAVDKLIRAITLLALAIFTLAGVIFFHIVADHRAIMRGLLTVGEVVSLLGLCGLIAWKFGDAMTNAVVNVSLVIESNFAAAVIGGRRGMTFCWKQVKRLNPDNYLTAWWYEAGLLALGVAAFCISFYFLDIHQHAYVREMWSVMHLRMKLGDFNPKWWEMALFFGGFLVAIAGYIRLFNRVADVFWYWRYQRRVAT